MDFKIEIFCYFLVYNLAFQGIRALIDKQNLQIMSASTQYPLLSFGLSHLLMVLIVCDDLTMTLYPAPGIKDPTPVSMYNSSLDQPFNTTFIEVSSFYNCSINSLYTYQQQNDEYKNNTPYLIVIGNFSSTSNPVTISTSTVYNVLFPLINGSSKISCDPAENAICTLEITNGCPSYLDFFHYFDIVQIKVDGFQKHFSYNVYCNTDYLSNTFEWGLLIEIIFCTVLVAVVSIYSRAWSIAGGGVSIDVPWVVGFNILLVIGGVVAIFTLQVVNVAVLILSWIFGTLGVALCANELIFLLKFGPLKKVLFKAYNFQFRIMEVISLLIGVGVCFGWWFSHKNWIVNDVVAVCMIVAGIKFFKFTSLKYAIFCYCVTITVEIIFVILIKYFINSSYNNAILNYFNNPFELQAPTINPVYNQKCSWLPITALIYPGCLVAYLRRFDSSRNTMVYFVVSMGCFLAGSILWMFLSILSPDSLPFGLIAEPLNLFLVVFFAWRRKEIKTLWTGKYYDQEFANKEGLQNLSDLIMPERQRTMSFKDSLFQGLHLGDEQSCIETVSPVRERTITAAGIKLEPDPPKKQLESPRKKDQQQIQMETLDPHRRRNS